MALRGGEEKRLSAKESEPRKRQKGSGGFYMHRAPPPNHGTKTIPIGAPNCLEGNQYVITGILDSLERDEAADLIRKYGGRVVSGVSKKVTHAIVGEEAGATKIQKIRELNIKTLSEDDLLETIRLTAPQPPPESQPQCSEMEVDAGALSLQLGDSQGVNANMMNDHQLWVEKYRPKTLKDICGHDANLQKFQQWMKDWLAEHGTIHQRQGPENDACKDPKAKGKRTKAQPSKASVPKICLLSGPPGLGKTTLAHAACHDLDFEVVEINASDNRKADDIQQILGGMIGNQAITGFFKVKGATVEPPKSRRRLALIMDEVDGADPGGMDVLFKLMDKATVMRRPAQTGSKGSNSTFSFAQYCSSHDS